MIKLHEHIDDELYAGQPPNTTPNEGESQELIINATWDEQ